MKTIRVLHEDVKLEQGGIESFLINVYRHIDREKVQFDFLVHREEEGFYDKEIIELGGRIYRTPSFNPFHYKSFMGSIELILKEHPEYKVIHAHSDLNMWPLIMAKKVGIQTRICHSHNAKSVLNLKYFFMLWEKLRIKRYCTNMFMCSTPAGIWSFGKKAVEKGNVVFIKNGIDVEKYEFNENIRHEYRKKFKLENKIVIGHVGRFMQQKNHTYLIDIFSEIHKKNRNTVLLLIGDGRLIEEIKRKVSNMGIDNAVKFLGLRDDVNKLMQAMDLFLFPSLWEGLPLTGVEAQTAGLPIVMSDVITNEVCITNNILKLSLKKPASYWAQSALDHIDRFNRVNVSDKIIESGFDIKTTAKWLEKFYLDMQK